MTHSSYKIFALLLLSAFSLEARAERFFRSSADASAAIAMDDHRFILADDEDNTLRIYDWNRPDSHPIAEIDLSKELYATGNNPETDIEGVARFNNRIVWITSHGRSKKGNFRPNRCRLFATTLTSDGKLTVDGVYTNLLSDLILYDQTWNLGLQQAIGTKSNAVNTQKIEDLAPKKRGLNIEALCTSADGTKMLIAFRNPRPKIGDKNMALIIPMANPEAVVLTGTKPQLEKPILIDLDGLGIRSMQYIPALKQHLIIAGSHTTSQDQRPFALYACDLDNPKPRKLDDFNDFNPEAILQWANQTDIILLSDDGSRTIDTPAGPIENKQLPRPQRTFRARIFPLTATQY